MFYNPVYEFDRMRALLDDLLSDSSSFNYKNEDIELTNVFENENGYMLQFLAPGVKLDDVSVDFANGILSISIKRKLDDNESIEKRILRKERSSLEFTRSYRVSSDADIDKIDAKMMNGLLMIFIPKKEESKPKKISIKVK